MPTHYVLIAVPITARDEASAVRAQFEVFSQLRLVLSRGITRHGFDVRPIPEGDFGLVTRLTPIAPEEIRP